MSKKHTLSQMMLALNEHITVVCQFEAEIDAARKRHAEALDRAHELQHELAEYLRAERKKDHK
jgi:hypothetical protein